MEEQIKQYIAELNKKNRQGDTTEHSFRPALQQLLEACTNCTVINEPRRIDCGVPDFTLISNKISIAYVETKDIEYDEYGHKVHQSYGNQVETDYSYSPLRQWMTQLETRLPGSGPNIQELYYTYDDVGNITTIEQYASAYSGLGGSYHNEYTYDYQYRLVSALGTSSNNLGYNFSMSYSPSGRIWHNSCGAPIVNKQVAYGYDDQFLTHQPRVVFDTIASDSYNLYWDLNGNLQEISNCKFENVRFHSWDEENRLRAVIGLKSAGLYGYDGNGNRVWKLTGDCRLESQNGGEQEYSAYLDDAVLYPNPYLTITPQGYTKHYYLGQERVATALGEGGWKMEPDIPNMREKGLASVYWGALLQSYPFGEIADPKIDNINETGTYPDVLQYDCPPLQLFRLLPTWNTDILLNCITSNINSSGHSELIYYTHNNHLGSASWITDVHGDPVQYIHYAPYGELLASQHAYGSSYDERYKFTGKERDAESGYDYYGARYQIVPLSIWGSPDPLLDKTIHMSSYMYCNGNPIKFIDPDGRIILFAPGVSESFKSDFKQAVSYMKQNGISGMLIQLMTSPNVYFLSEGIEYNSNEFNPNTKTITWNSRLGVITDNLYEMSPVEALNHEIDHAWGYETNPVQQQMLGKIEDPNYGNLEEKRVIMGSEQETAQKLGKLKPGEVTRNNHNGSAYETTSPISTESKWSFTPSKE